MTHYDLEKCFSRYLIYCAKSIDRNSRTALDRREYLENVYCTLIGDGLVICRDPYQTQLIKLYEQGNKLRVPLHTIYAEMERFRIEYLKYIYTEAGGQIQSQQHSSLFKSNAWPKYNVVVHYFAVLMMVRLVREWLKKDFPFSLLDSPVEETIIPFTIPVQLFEQKTLSAPTIVSKKETSEKQRRLEYPQEMNAKEAAEYLNTTLLNLYQLTSAHRVPHYKRGRKLVFKKTELENWALQKVSTDEELGVQSSSYLLGKRGKKK